MVFRPDSRDIKSGSTVSDLNGYYDSQNIIVIHETETSSASSLDSYGKQVLSCVLHHSDNHEGGDGLTLSSTRSTDGGKTWSALKPIEPNRPGVSELNIRNLNSPGGSCSKLKSATQLQQSHDGYQLLVGNRIYLFYGWNKGSQPGSEASSGEGVTVPRTDMQADAGFWMRWSDDFGRSFLGGRVLIPIRRTAIDNANPWAGKTIGAFCCDKPSIIDNMVFFAFQKTRDGNGESYGSEVFFMRSKDLLSLHYSGGDVSKASWEMLPRGERGLQTGRGLFLGEEPHIVQVHKSRVLCFWRTELGFLDSAYSSDYGETWERQADDCPQPLVYRSRGNDSEGRHDDIASPKSVANGNGHISESNLKRRRVELTAESSLSKISSKPGCNPECKAYSSIPLAKKTQDAFRSNVEDYLSNSKEYQDKIRDPQNVIRNPRGAITPFRTKDGFTALLYYNNGHTERLGYVGRLICWLVLGKPWFNSSSQKWEMEWGQPEIALYWDGVQLDSRDEWNEDWAIVDGAGYADFQELSCGRLVLVASNKLTVRYHEIDPGLLHGMKCELLGQVRVMPKEIGLYGTQSAGPVFSWTCSASSDRIKGESSHRFRAPVLPDLRGGGGFTLSLTVDLDALLRANRSGVLVDGRTIASAALDEPAVKTTSDAAIETIKKGFVIQFVAAEKGNQEKLEISVHDGFKANFVFPIINLRDSYYRSSKKSSGSGNSNLAKLSIIFDGGPKTCSCVFNDKVYNAAPAGWLFFPREFGEIGGSDIEIYPDFGAKGVVHQFSIHHEARRHCDCIMESWCHSDLTAKL